MNRKSLSWPRLLLASALSFAASNASALEVSQISPQGEVRQPRQVMIRFDQSAVRLGDAQAAAPFRLACDPSQATAGEGRWTSDREWVLDFSQPLPAGVRCELRPEPGFRSLSGDQLAHKAPYRFHTGGPKVVRILPAEGTPIEESQVFVLQLDAAATLDSLQAGIRCGLSDVGEQVPVRILKGDERQQLLAAAGYSSKQIASETALPASDSQRLVALQCQRRLSAGTAIRLHYRASVQTASGLRNSRPHAFAYTVRQPFQAELQCERENATSACLPIRPLTIRFNAPVPAALARQVRLRHADKAFSPRLPGDSQQAPVQTAAPARDSAEDDTLVESLQFDPPFAEGSSYTVDMPEAMQDASGRPLANADSFPLSIPIGPMPPLARFAAAPFAVIERFASGPDEPALLPLTLRRVEPSLDVRQLHIHALGSQHNDAEIIHWLRKTAYYSNGHVPRQRAAADIQGALPAIIDPDSNYGVETRMVSLLDGQPNVKVLELPAATEGEQRPFEVIGVPLSAGFHILEIPSRTLGKALLAEGYGPSRTLYVRTAALVTNLGVHFKLGRSNALAWVTSLDQGKPVADAQVQVSDCQGKVIARASTDAQGIARFRELPEPPRCRDDYYPEYASGYFVSARAHEQGIDDFAFTWSNWQRGIEPWRFNVPFGHDAQPDIRVHTVLDRSLLRAGETVSMKHYIRTETGPGAGSFGLPERNPTTLEIRHVGSGQTFSQPLHWRDTPSGGRSAENRFELPAAARPGQYQLTQVGEQFRQDSGSFRVEAFRLPTYEGRISVGDASGPLLLTAEGTLPVDIHIDYVSGGPASSLPVHLSASLRDWQPEFSDYPEFSFSPPDADAPDEAGADLAGENAEDEGTTDAQASGMDDPESNRPLRQLANRRPLVLDANGSGRTVLELPAARRAQRLQVEASYADPNGEIQTLSSSRTLWPADVVAGIRAEGWVSAGRQLRLQAIALGLDGKPSSGTPLRVRALSRQTLTSRKRMVGGFYQYDSQIRTRDLGTLCEGNSDAQGLLECRIELSEPGEVVLLAAAQDSSGHSIEAARSIWVTRQGELWFGGEEHDRMDVIAEKKSYAPGEIARFQVRMPFREATALVTVEREGIIDTHLVTLKGDDPTISLPVDAGWSPNVYVSVLALRGRLYDVPWYRALQWGMTHPSLGWHAIWQDKGQYAPPNTLIDLSKPAFRFGMAEIRVGSQAHRLDVKVQTDRRHYQVREQAQVTIQVRKPDGTPAGHAEVALAAVDRALLELMPNHSWQLLQAMLARRAWGVATATTQMEIVGRRHYGRKAMPPGGGGGSGESAPVRELFDTLLLWQPRITTDALGQASVQVPLNDAISRFEIVAIADSDTALFGTGRTEISINQDLRIISGLPPLVREGDQFRAMLTLRNSTEQAMKVLLRPQGAPQPLAEQTIKLPAGAAQQVHWDVKAPALPASGQTGRIDWRIEARDLNGRASDTLVLSQQVLPAVPVAVQQASLLQLDAAQQLPVAPPATALPGRGGLQLVLQPRLADGLPAVQDWFRRYPYTCLEQQGSKALVLGERPLWQQLMSQMPAYLDSDGLASYFPPQPGSASQGSDTLSAWLLASTDAVSHDNPDFALPAGIRQSLLDGLARFVEGRIERRHWAPRDDLVARKLAAVAALAQHGAARPAMLASLDITPVQWPTSAVLDWISILRQLHDMPGRTAHLTRAMQVLRSRISYQGSRLVFNTEAQDDWWWLMVNGDVNAARLLLTVLNEPDWRHELGRLAAGLIARQQQGAWQTTQANFWGWLALRRFSAIMENTPVTGQTEATLAHGSGGSTTRADWSNQTMHQMFLPWPAPATATVPGQPDHSATLTLQHQGQGQPWLSLQSLAAVPRTQPIAAGYRLKRQLIPIQQARPELPAGQYSRGDVLRIRLDIEASAPMSWVAISDPVPAGSSILGSGLGRDSALLSEGEQSGGAGWLAYEERGAEAFRAYYQQLPAGRSHIEYTLRLNNPGLFQLPPSRAEALYAPEMFGEIPNQPLRIWPMDGPGGPTAAASTAASLPAPTTPASNDEPAAGRKGH